MIDSFEKWKNAQRTSAIGAVADLQKAIVQNKLAQGFADVNRDHMAATVCGLAEELGEFAKARKKDNTKEMIDELGDMMVYCLGALEVLGANGYKVIEDTIKKNADRTGQKSH
jgi:NTP pyrophosphatase (non-canonical NTP hydrolase)